MAAGEITGASPSELEKLREEYKDTPLGRDGLPFEDAYCLNKIGKQPDEYDGPQRFCKRRAAKKDDYDGPKNTPESRAVCCHTHGGDQVANGHKHKDNLENPRTARLKHGLRAEDKSLMMDFDEDEQELFDTIMEDWPEIYDWPSREEDPARYRILRRVAVNEVRSQRGEEYLDRQGEVYEEPVYDEDGVQVGEKDRENPLAREYRLLLSEITDQMRELGLTPKERQKMDSLESEAEKNDAVSEIAQEALNEGNDYDPEQFSEESG